MEKKKKKGEESFIIISQSVIRQESLVELTTTRREVTSFTHTYSYLIYHDVVIFSHVQNLSSYTHSTVNSHLHTHHVTGECMILDHDLVPMLSRSIKGTEQEV